MTPLYVGLLCALVAMTILLFMAVFAALVYRQAWDDAEIREAQWRATADEQGALHRQASEGACPIPGGGTRIRHWFKGEATCLRCGAPNPRRVA